MTGLAETVKALREERGISIKQASARAGVSRTYYSRIESGERCNPSIETIIKIASLFDIDPSLLIKKCAKF